MGKKSKKARPPRYRALGISLALSLAMLGGGALFLNLSLGVLGGKLAWPLTRLMGFIALGLVAGQIIETMGWTRSLAVTARPLFRFGHLGDRCGAAFTAAFISGVTANAMLLEFYQEEKISKSQLFLSNFVNQFPAYFLHLPTTFFIVLPLTGRAGVIYFTLTFAAVLVRTTAFLVYGHFFLAPVAKGDGFSQTGTQKKRPGVGDVLAGIRGKFPARVINIAIFVLPVYIAVFLVNRAGGFVAANEWVASVMTTTFMPVEALSVVVLSFAAEFTSGFAAAGALLSAGAITVKQTALALIMGNILAFPIRALRHQLPRYMGIFSPKMGSQLLLLGQFFRVASLILVTLVYYWLF